MQKYVLENRLEEKKNWYVTMLGIKEEINCCKISVNQYIWIFKSWFTQLKDIQLPEETTSSLRTAFSVTVLCSFSCVSESSWSSCSGKSVAIDLTNSFHVAVHLFRMTIKNLLVFYHECVSLIGYVIHYIFCLFRISTAFYRERCSICTKTIRYYSFSNYMIYMRYVTR